MSRFVICLAAVVMLAPVTAQGACEKVEHEPVDLALYYADTVGRTGDELKATLNQIINSHVAYSYTP
mgnify:FL=1